MKRITLLLIAALAVVTAQAATVGKAAYIKAHPRYAGNNYQAYPDSVLPALTPAPDGYTPFFLDHYGRHGSRWLINPKQYSRPVDALMKARDAGKITERGLQVFTTLCDVLEASDKRLGELSDIGAEQHQRIARRMVANFPEIFYDADATVRARSTVVIRCILSMQNEVDQIAALCPALPIATDASLAEMYYMNYSDPVVKPLRKQARPALESYRDKWLRSKTMLKKLFTDVGWAERNIDLPTFTSDLWSVSANMQSHHAFEKTDLLDIFGDDLYNLWRYENASWYITSGNTPLTGGRVPYMEANLLRSLIEDADHAIALSRTGASLRFGHESVLLPLVCLMNVNGMGYSTSDLETLDRYWTCADVFPMAGNLQLVFYRNAAGDILVKALLNEREATLPLTPVTGPYYRWADVRDHYLRLLADVPAAPTPIE